MFQADIELVHDFRYVYDTSAEPWTNRAKFSIHLNDRGTAWDPKLMLATHEEQERGRARYPDWDGTCKRDGSTFFIRHPRGLRCKSCGAFA